MIKKILLKKKNLGLIISSKVGIVSKNENGGMFIWKCKSFWKKISIKRNIILEYKLFISVNIRLDLGNVKH